MNCLTPELDVADLARSMAFYKADPITPPEKFEHDRKVQVATLT